MGNTFKRRHWRPDYGQQHGHRAQQHTPPEGQHIVSERELAAKASCSVATIDKLARGGIIPTAGRDDRGFPLFDLNDERVAEWLKAATATQSEA